MARMAEMTPLTGRDYSEINNLISGFFHCVDSGDTRAFVQLFVPEGTVELVKTGKTFQGTAALEGFCNFLHTTFAGTQHWEGNVLIRSTTVYGFAHKATNVSYWSALKAGRVMSNGRHEDSFERHEGEWRFVSRRIVHCWTAADGDAAGSAAAPVGPVARGDVLRAGSPVPGDGENGGGGGAGAGAGAGAGEPASKRTKMED